MFFGPGDTLAEWLRRRFSRDFRSWDEHSMQVHAVQTQGKDVHSVVCVVLRSKPGSRARSHIHRVYVINVETKKVVYGREGLWLQFRHDYLEERI